MLGHLRALGFVNFSAPCPTIVQDLDSLSTLPRLKYLSLVDNPVAKQPNYRLYVIARCKKLKMLDFRKVKQKVRHLPVICLTWDQK